MLPLLSKIFGKHIHQALYNYMRNNDFLYNLQFGFRRSHSTETALIRLIDQLLSDMDKDRVSGLVFVDYKKAFDLIDHGILLSKLEAYGVASKELLLATWELLNNSRQSVVMEGMQLEHRLITWCFPGISPGAAFVYYFCKWSSSCSSQSIVDIYVDDTTLSASAAVSDLPAVQQWLQDRKTNRIADWTSENRMVLNTSQTKTLLVTGKHLEKKISNKTLKIACNGSEIEQVTSQKLLGVT